MEETLTYMAQLALRKHSADAIKKKVHSGIFVCAQQPFSLPEKIKTETWRARGDDFRSIIRFSTFCCVVGFKLKKLLPRVRMMYESV